MLRVAILGADDAGRRMWEAVTRCGDVEVTAFVDVTARRQGGQLLGVEVRALEWLSGAVCDAVVMGNRPDPALTSALVSLGVAGDRLVHLPVDLDDERLARAAAERFPDPLRPLLERPAPAGVRIGVFGTGTAAVKVWEALAEIDDVEPVWFADNDVRRQGKPFLELDVIAPSQIRARSFDVVAIGSMSLDTIERQLIALGVAPDRILTPDVTQPVDVVRAQLAEALAERLGAELLA